MNQLNRVMKFQNYDIKKSTLVFWGTMILVNILSYVSNFYINSKNITFGPLIRHESAISFAASNILAITIYLIINWIIMYHENFSLAIYFGATRKNFYKSIIVHNIIVASIFSIIQGTLQIIDRYIMESFGYRPLVEFGLFNTETDNVFFIFLVLFLIFSTIISISNLIGILQFKFGYKFWIGFGIVFILSQILFSNILISIIYIFGSIFDAGLSILFPRSLIFLTFMGISILCYIVGYFLIIKLSIK